MLVRSKSRDVVRYRHSVFRISIGPTLLLAVYVVGVLPYVRHGNSGPPLIGLPIPVVMIAILFIGLGWLAWLASGRRHGEHLK